MHERPDQQAAPPAAAAAAALPHRLREWAGALARLPELLATMAFRRRSLQDELEEAALGGTLRRSLSALDLWCLVGRCPHGFPCGYVRVVLACWGAGAPVAVAQCLQERRQGSSPGDAGMRHVNWQPTLLTLHPSPPPLN